MSVIGNAIMVGGKGISDADAVLTVFVSAGSTVTATKDGVTLTPTMWVQATDPTRDCALFVIAPNLFDAVNAWTVTVTYGAISLSETVTISSNKVYDLHSVIGNIYMHGEQYQQFTGGFEVVRVSSYTSAPIAQVSYGTTPNGVISLSVSGTNANGAVCTVNPIDLTQFSTITAKFESSFPNSSRLFVMANSSKSGITMNNANNRNCDFWTAVGESISDVTLDVSSANGSFYLLFGGFTVGPAYACSLSEWHLS